MRLIPLLTALAVTAFLVLAVLQRDALYQFARENHLALLLGETDDADAAEPPAAPEPQETRETPAPEGVRVVARHSQAEVVDTAVILRGQTEAAREVSVMAETSGLVISEPLRKGAFVEPGQLLCELDPGTRGAALDEALARLEEAEARVPGIEAGVPEAEARLQEALARLDEAEINARAANALKRDGFSTETRVAATQAAVRSAEASVSAARAGIETAKSGLKGAQAAIRTAEAAVAVARKEIDRLQVTAPFAGLLDSDAAELGTLMQPGALCATIIQLDPIKLVAYVPETEVARIALGAMAGAQLAEGSDVRGEVTFLSRSADPTTRTFRVEITAANPELRIRDGQTAEIAISTEGVAAHLLPASVLTLNDEGALGIRSVTEDSTVAFLPVTLLRDTREGVWLAGLPDRVDVITLGQEYVESGVRVIPTFREVTAEVSQ
ncbi:efflux RND transporter periplasmic adaptor subunit [Marinovum sp.]|uniref:efflux RND transporter periplasmic adaptor subunit n=1 Tax=Marinovum sp. TaxID=2024839 RepID=UPI002B275DC0|nr:efflux RND transporter periplasmic adaptor subunit [Marinovum sp.]